MSTVVVRQGLADLLGSTVKGLFVTRMVSRHPPRYETQCGVCSAKRVFSHTQLTSGTARCIADGCGKKPVTRPAALSTDVRVPAVRSRDSDAARQFQAEKDAQQRKAEREAKEHADQETRNRQKQGHREFMREGIATGIDPLAIAEGIFDEEANLAPGETADEYNRREADEFRKTCPDYYACADNMALLTGYVTRNAPKLKLVSAKQWEMVYNRLSNLGLLKQRPAPEPTPESTPEPVADDGSEKGWDEGGNPLKLTRRQVAALSSDEYRRFKRIYRDQLDSLPRSGPGPKGRFA